MKRISVALTVTLLAILFCPGCANQVAPDTSSSNNATSASSVEAETSVAVSSSAAETPTAVSSSTIETPGEETTGEASASSDSADTAPAEEIIEPAAQSERGSLEGSSPEGGSQEAGSQEAGSQEAAILLIDCNGTTLTASFAETEAARALAEQLSESPIQVSLHEYGGFEKIGSLPNSLPTSDEQMSTQTGDIVLYQGNQISFFYSANSWSYTRLGHVDGMSSDELFNALGGLKQTEVTLSLG